MIPEMENIHVMVDQDRYLREPNRNKKQKAMPEALKGISWWQKWCVLVTLVGIEKTLLKLP